MTETAKTQQRSSMKKKYKYMHTMDNEPAYYVEGSQVCFACTSRPIILVDDLRTLRKQQKMSDKWRLEHGYEIDHRFGYMKVAVP